MTTMTTESTTVVVVSGGRLTTKGGRHRRRRIVGECAPASSSSRLRKDGSLCLRRFGRSAKILAKTTVGASSSDDAGKKDEGRYDFIEDITDENVLTTSLNRAYLGRGLFARVETLQTVTGGAKRQRRTGREGDFVRLANARHRGVDGVESGSVRVSVSNRDSEESDEAAMLDGDRLIVISAQPEPGRRWRI